MNPKSAAFLFLIAVALVGAQTQSTDTARNPADSAYSNLYNLSFEPVGPGDLIGVYVGQYEDATRTFRVSAAGTIELPVLKRALQVAQMTSSEIEKEISQALIEAHLLVDPVVSVSVLEYRSKPVNLVGAVHEPITVQAIGGLQLLGAISKAGGLAPEAGPEIIVSRPELGGQPAYVRHIAVKELMGNSDSQLNIELQGGEEIRVPVADKLYIAGNVKNPGSYPMDQAGGLTVLQALALCQGTLSFTQPMAVVYRLRPESPVRVEINVPLRDIIKRRVQDMPLLPNDIFYVLDASARRASATVLERIASFGGATTTGLIVYGNR